MKINDNFLNIFLGKILSGISPGKKEHPRKILSDCFFRSENNLTDTLCVSITFASTVPIHFLPDLIVIINISLKSNGKHIFHFYIYLDS